MKSLHITFKNKNWKTSETTFGYWLFIFGFLFFSNQLSAQGNIIDGGIVGISQSICAGETPSSLENITDPTGGSGQIEYLWLVRTASSGTWTEVSNSNTIDYQPPALYVTTYYQRCSRRAGNLNYTGETPIITITVNLPPFNQIKSPLTALTEGEPNQFEATYVSGSPTYKWDFGPGANPSTAMARIVPNVIFSIPGTQNITLTVISSAGCKTVVTYQYTVTSILPVELIRFSGEAVSNSVFLSWTTASEINNKAFEVWKKSELKDWQLMATIEGQAFSNQEVSYQLEDEAPFIGANYYQLRQIDFDGTINLSTILFVESDRKATVKIYPNPVQDIAEINLGDIFQQTDNGNIQIFQTATGKLIFDKIINTDDANINIAMTDWSSGSYFLRIIANNQTIFSQNLLKN